MKKPKSNINDVVDEFKKTLDARGPDATAAILRNGREQLSENTDMQFVVLMVCNHFGISTEQMLADKTDTTKYAKGFIIYYLRTTFSIEWSHIKILLNHRDQSWLWELMNLIKKLKPKLPMHVTWISHRDHFDKKIKEYQSKK